MEVQHGEAVKMASSARAWAVGGDVNRDGELGGHGGNGGAREGEEKGNGEQERESEGVAGVLSLSSRATEAWREGGSR